MESYDPLHKALLSWYAKNGRHALPWRDKTLQERAYCVLVSEIMLQQTQVKVVLERYFFQFLQKFPNLKALANAKEEEVLCAWSGLGYYSRARNLQKLAKLCTQAKDSTLPKDTDLLAKLPGIGAYTAGAVACFGYDMQVSFVDSNIKRILIRLFALTNPTQKTLQHKAKEILNTNDAFNHNQALLDLGALICSAKSPKCSICPLQDFCSGKEKWQILTPNKTSQNIKESLHYLIYIKDSKIALCKSQDRLYFGLYNFPQIHFTPLEKPFYIFKHSYTKYNLKAHCYLCISDYLKQFLASQNLEFFTQKDLDSIPLSSLSNKILNFLKSNKLF